MNLWAFAGVSLLLAVTPGPDFALVTRNALAFGRRGTLLTCLGLTTALSLWVVASAAGIVALLRASPTLFEVLKTIGGVYLAYLGVSGLWASRHPVVVSDSALPAMTPSSRAIWRQGFLSALLNPKLGVFFVTFLPQFVDTARPVAPQILLLGALFIVIGIAWMLGYGLSVARLRDVVMSPRVRQWLQRITGVVLVGFGVVLVVSR